MTICSSGQRVKAISIEVVRQGLSSLKQLLIAVTVVRAGIRIQEKDNFKRLGKESILKRRKIGWKKFLENGRDAKN